MNQVPALHQRRKLIPALHQRRESICTAISLHQFYTSALGFILLWISAAWLQVTFQHLNRTFWKTVWEIGLHNRIIRGQVCFPFPHTNWWDEPEHNDNSITDLHRPWCEPSTNSFVVVLMYPRRLKLLPVSPALTTLMPNISTQTQAFPSLAPRGLAFKTSFPMSPGPFALVQVRFHISFTLHKDLPAVLKLKHLLQFF